MAGAGMAAAGMAGAGMAAAAGAWHAHVVGAQGTSHCAHAIKLGVAARSNRMTIEVRVINNTPRVMVRIISATLSHRLVQSEIRHDTFGGGTNALVSNT